MGDEHLSRRLRREQVTENVSRRSRHLVADATPRRVGMSRKRFVVYHAYVRCVKWKT